MALTSSFPIKLSDIQTETSSTDLVSASNSAGFTLPTAMSEFLGYSADLVLFDAGSFHSNVTYDLTTNAQTQAIARIGGGDIELGGEQMKQEDNPCWGKCAIDLTNINVSNYSNLEIVARIVDTTYASPGKLYGKYSDTQHEVCAADFCSSSLYDFQLVDGTNLTESFQTFTVSLLSGFQYLNLSGYFDSSSSIVDSNLYLEISKLTLV